MSTLVETKIDTTHRLEQDGRWKTASRFRHKRRQELRESGMSKSDARETAWDEMAWRFQPIDKKWRLYHLCAARNSSSFIPGHLRWRFRNAWSVTFHLLACFGSQDESLRQMDVLTQTSDRWDLQKVQAPTGEANEESLRAILCHNDATLLNDLEAELSVVGEALTGDEPGVIATREEVQLALGAFPLLRDSAATYWPLPDEISA